MTSIHEALRRFITPPDPIPAGIYHYQTPADAPLIYRLHLRVEPDGYGVLIVNASTVLHLNKTATEYAYHILQQTEKQKVFRSVSSRYRITLAYAQQDFENFASRIQELIHTPDLDPEIYFDFNRRDPYSGTISAPYRMDCALTYRLPAGTDPEYAPGKRVERELTTSEWKQILDKCWNAGIPHIIFTGGEPTLRDDLPELIHHAEGLGQVSGLLTDGMRFTDRSYLETILQTGLDHMMINFHPNYQQAEEALQNLLKSNIAVVAHLTLTSDNKSSIFEWIERFAEIGLKAISLSTISTDLSETLIKLRNRAAEVGLSLVWDLPVPYSSMNPINLELVREKLIEGAGKAWLYVEPDGDVLPAQGINHTFGNLLRDPWETVWGQAKNM